jgi:hypothetical protein
MRHVKSRFLIGKPSMYTMPRTFPQSKRWLASIALCALTLLLVLLASGGAEAQRRRKPARTTPPPPQQGANANTQTAQQKPQKKNITPLRSGDTTDGSRITITSDAPLNDYSAYRSGDRYYVVIPEANAPRAQGGLRGRGFEDVQVQRRGNDAVLSFKLQPGTNARVSQRFNRLDVELTAPGAKTATTPTATPQVVRPPVTQPTPQTVARPTPQTSTAGNTSQATNTPVVPGSNNPALGQPQAGGNPSVVYAPTPDATASPGVSPEANPVASPPAEQIAQAQPPTAIQPATTTNPATATSGTTLGAVLRQNWLVILIAALVLLSLVMIVAARSRAKGAATAAAPTRRTSLKEKREARKAAAALAAAEAAKAELPEAVVTPEVTTPKYKTATLPKAKPVKSVAEAAPVIVDEATKEIEVAPAVDVERVESEVGNVLAGESYDSEIIAASDVGTRGLVATGLLAALASRTNPERQERAREAFIKHDYFDEATRTLRTAEAPAERAAAARSLGFVKDKSATMHLVVALEDDAPEVRQAAVESLAELRDPAAVEPLKSLLKRERDRKVSRSLIKRAIAASAAAVTVAESSAAVAEAETETLEAPAVAVEEQPASALADVSTAESVPDIVTATAAPPLVTEETETEAEEAARREAEEERIRVEAERERQAEEEARLAAEAQAEEERRQAEEAARLQAEEEARAHAAEAERLRLEEEARLEAEAEAQRLAAEEEARQRAEEAARLKAQQEAEESERQRVEEEARRQAAAEAQRKAEEEARLQAEELERRQAEEAAARQRAEQEERERVAAQERREAEAVAARLQLEQEAARKRAEEEEARRQAEAQALRLEEEARVQAEAEARERRAQEEARQQALEAERKRQAEEEARLALEAEERRRAEAERARQLAAEEAAAALKAETTAPAELEAPDETIETFAAEQLEVAPAVDPLIERHDAGAGDWVEVDISDPEIVRHVEPIAPSTAAQPELLFVEPELQELEAPSAAESKELEPADLISLEEPAAKPVSKEIEHAVTEKGVAEFDEFSTVPGAILKRLSSEEPEERAAAVADLARVGSDDSFRQINAAFDDPAVEVRNAAARSLFSLNTDRAATFTRALRESPPERRRKIGSALASSGLASEAIGQLMGESREKTYDAFSLLFLMSKAGEVQPLMRAIEEHPNNEVRLAVVKLLALSGQQEILPAFRRLAVRGSLPTEVRSAVMEAIYQISSQSPTAV